MSGADPGTATFAGVKSTYNEAATQAARIVVESVVPDNYITPFQTANVLSVL